MRILGLRCSNTDFAFALVSGHQSHPRLDQFGLTLYPKGYSKPQSLKWFFQELQELTQGQKVDGWVLKGIEPMATRNKSFVERVEYEGVATLAAAEMAIECLHRKVKATMAKDFGFPGKPKALMANLDTSLIPDFQQQPVKIQEAILAAWSELE